MKKMRTVYDNWSKRIYDYRISDEDNMIKMAEYISHLDRTKLHIEYRDDIKRIFNYLSVPWWRFIMKYKARKVMRNIFLNNNVLDNRLGYEKSKTKD